MERALRRIETTRSLKMDSELTPCAVPLRSKKPEFNAPLKVSLSPEALRHSLPGPMKIECSTTLTLLDPWRGICGRHEAISEGLRGEEWRRLYPPEQGISLNCRERVVYAPLRR